MVNHHQKIPNSTMVNHHFYQRVSFGSAKLAYKNQAGPHLSEMQNQGVPRIGTIEVKYKGPL